MHDDTILERLLMLICAEAATLRAELDAIASQLRAEDRDRFEGTLSDIQARSTEILMELSAVTVN
jgi:hypothetical protein